MKRYNVFIVVISVLLPLSSCTEIQLIEESASSHKSKIQVTVASGDYMNGKNICETHGEFGKYKSYFSNPDATIGVSSSRYYQLGEEKVFAFYDPGVKTKSVDDHSYDIQLNSRALFSPSTKSGDGFISQIFGSKARFGISGLRSETKTTGSEEVELYAPSIIRIEFPSVSEDIRYPLCYYKNFIVRWNQDENNDNGVIIHVVWNGTMVFGDDYSNSYVTHTVCVPDTGVAELDDVMFDGIPDAAYCRMYLYRGDLDNIEVNEENYRIFVETHDVLDFIIVRNIEYENGEGA